MLQGTLPLVEGRHNPGYAKRQRLARSLSPLDPA